LFREVFPGRGVGLDVGGLGAHFDAHVAQHQPFLDREGGYGFAGKFDAFVDRRILFQVANDVEDKILGHDAGEEGAALEDDLHHFGNPEPKGAIEKDDGHVGGADACPEGSQGAERRGMGVRFDDDRTRGDETVLDEKLMANAPAYVEEVFDAHGRTEFAHLLMIIRRLYGGGGLIMVENEGGSLRMPHPCPAQLIEGFHYLEVEIVHFGDIDLAVTISPADTLFLPEAWANIFS